MDTATRCPLCGAAGAYIGLNVVECGDRRCTAYAVAPAERLLVTGAQWRATIARVRATAAAANAVGCT